MAQTGKIYSSHISNILNNLQGEVSFTVEDDTAPIFDTLFSQNAFNSIPEGSTISKIEIKFQSKINRSESRYKAQWSIYDVGYPLDWDGNYTGYTNLPKYQSTWTSSSKMSLLTNQYQSFTCTIDNPSLDAIRTGLMVRTRVTYEDTRFLGTNSSTVYIKDFHVIAYYTPPTYTLDLNGSLDGGNPNSNISGWGTADVYINGSLSSWEEKPSSGVNDFYGSFERGTTYEIKNIVAKSGYKYVGNSSYSGTLTSNTTIVLPFETKTASTNMIYVGTKQPTFYIGTKQVQSIYLGTSLIYEVILPKISYDSIKTVENLIVPSGETSNTYTLPAANLENAEGNISYALYSDNECTTPVGTGITFDENTRQVTISNAAKDTVATQDADKDGLAKFYVKATYESLSAIGEITLENYKVTATFSYLNKEDTYVDKTTEVYYGTSVEEFAKGITDYKLPENDKNCHYINNGWVDFYGEYTIKSVKGDTTFVLSVSSEAHDIDPTIAGYDKKEPTCTEDGYIKGYCRYCAEQKDGYKGLIQIDLKATGHTDTDDDGICDVCGKSIVTIVDSGTCGSNLTYALDSNGVLTISGTGDMQNSSFGWDKNKIKSVIINDGVTSIGKEAFKNCTNLTSITIPDCITSIGDSAFDNCTGLTSVIIPGSVMSIGRYAFLQCTGLTSITISDGVTSIGSSAFAYCKSLTSVTIPDSVTSIEGNVIYGCTVLIGITVSSGNTVYHSAGNCLIETGSKTLISGCKSSIIPADGSVTSINRSAFLNCKGLTSITIPDSVTSIGESAFYGCTGLTEVDFSACTDIPTLEHSNVFSNTYSDLVIKVPSDLVDQWKAATNWSTYADKIVGVRL